MEKRLVPWIKGIAAAGMERIGGDTADDAIVRYVKDSYNITIGKRTAESIKIAAGSAHRLTERGEVTVCGRNILTGQVVRATLYSSEIREAITPVLDDLTAKDAALRQGETVKLNGDQAYIYVRSRDTGEFDSATERMRRQKQYLNAFIPKARQKAKTASGAMSVYNKAEDYLFTNVEYARLAEELADLDYDPDEDMYEIPGEVRMGEQYEEFYTDETGFYEMILKIFYKEVA